MQGEIRGATSRSERASVAFSFGCRPMPSAVGVGVLGEEFTVAVDHCHAPRDVAACVADAINNRDGGRLPFDASVDDDGALIVAASVYGPSGDYFARSVRVSVG